MRPKRNAILVSLAIVWLLAGCASVRPYQESYPKNLSFSSPGLEGSFLWSREVSLHVFFDEDDCKLAYQGSIVLNPGDGPGEIGLPTDREVYARIWAHDRNWFQNRTKTRSDEFRLSPRKDHRYDVQYTSRRKMYGRKIEETHLRTGRTRELRPDGWGDCAS